MDYGKFKYEQSKKQQKQKKKTQHIAHGKEVKFRPFTGEHDFEVKLRHICEFLEKGLRVKITVVFRGREVRFKEHGENILNRISAEIEELGMVEKNAKMEGRNLTMHLIPKK